MTPMGRIYFLASGCLPPGEKNSPPIIGATCAFDAKIYKNVDSLFGVSLCKVWNKKFFKISDFSFQLPSLLVEN